MNGNDRLYILFAVSYGASITHAGQLLPMFAMLAFAGMYIWFSRESAHKRP